MFSNVSRLHCCLAFAPCVLITFFLMQEKVAVSKPVVQLKQIQNKSLMCKPIMMTKATSCNPIRIHKITQTGLLLLCFLLSLLQWHLFCCTLFALFIFHICKSLKHVPQWLTHVEYWFSIELFQQA